MKPRPLSPPASDDPDASRLVLRDGSVVALRTAGPADRDAIREFFHALTPLDRYRRFLSSSEPSDDTIDRYCGAQDPARGLTLLATRIGNGTAHVVASATYIVTTTGTAEVAFAIAQEMQGHGLGTLLLEQLVARAQRHGLERLTATALTENMAMLDVFRDSGFQVKANLTPGCTDVELTLTPDRVALAAMDARRRQATVRSLQPLLAPSSIVVIGASRDPQKVGSRVLSTIIAGGFTGRLDVVHSSAPLLQGITTVSTVQALSGGVDLAVICLPAEAVLGIADECGRAGVRALLVISAGFAETGSAGLARQQALVERARGYGMRLLGPNCLGAMNFDTRIRLNASFSPTVSPAGDIGFVSQSGALGIAILDLAAERGLGLSTFVSIGNRADVSSNDLLEYWEEDAATQVVLLYLESFGNPRRFTRIARRVSQRKPIVALKAGRSTAGARAAGSHTAAMASRDAIVDAVLQQTGVIRAVSAEEMLDVAACLTHQPLPAGRRVAIVTNAGGPGILAADACEAAGLRMADFSADTNRLLTALPAAASRRNPIDMMAAAPAATYRLTLDAVLKDPGVDAVVVIYTPIETARSASIFAAIGDAVAAARADGRRASVLACVTAHARPTLLSSAAERIPVYLFPENAVRALAQASRYAEWKAAGTDEYFEYEDVRVAEARHTCALALKERGSGWLTFEETNKVLRAFQLPVLESRIATTPDAAVQAAASFGFPVVAKVVARAGQHKSDVGGVITDIATDDRMRDTFQQLRRRALAMPAGAVDDGVLIQPMVKGGVETFVGVTHDAVFGSVIGFGEGGVNVELRHDVRFRTVPLSEHDITSLLSETWVANLLNGYRGHAPADRESLRMMLRRVSQLADAVPEIVELDLNPVIVLGEGNGARIVDARIRLEQAR